MIADKEHSELRNLMTPLVNYFSMKKNMIGLSPSDFSKANKIANKELKIIFASIPRIREILNGATVSEVRECGFNGDSICCYIADDGKCNYKAHCG